MNSDHDETIVANNCRHEIDDLRLFTERVWMRTRPDCRDSLTRVHDEWNETSFSLPAGGAAMPSRYG